MVLPCQNRRNHVLLERAQIASLALLANDMIDAELERELLENAGAFNVVLRRNEVRQLMLSADMPKPIAATFDLRDPAAGTLIMDALARLINTTPEVVRVIGSPTRDAGDLIEITMPTAPLTARALPVRGRSAARLSPRHALRRMLASLKPGGWLVVEDSDFVTMDSAPLPEPFRTLHEVTTHEGQRRRPWWDRHYGRKLLSEFQALGLEEVHADGEFWTMRGGTESAEAYVLALEYGAASLVERGLIEQETALAALAQARRPDFAIVSPLHAIAMGRKAA